MRKLWPRLGKESEAESRPEFPVWSSQSPHQLQPWLWPGTVCLRFPSQGSELHARHWGLQCPLLGLPQFPCEATEICLTSYTYGLPHFHPRQLGSGFLLRGLWPPSYNWLPQRSPKKLMATPSPQLSFPTLPTSYICCENLFPQSTLRDRRRRSKPSVEPRRSGFKPALCYSLGVWPWASCFTSGSPYFSIY